MSRSIEVFLPTKRFLLNILDARYQKLGVFTNIEWGSTVVLRKGNIRIKLRRKPLIGLRILFINSVRSNVITKFPNWNPTSFF